MMVWIVTLSTIWIAPLVCLLLKNEAKFKKNIAVGVTLPFEGREDAEVLAALGRFKKELLWVCIGLVVLGAASCLAGGFAGGFALTMALWGLWVDLCIVLPYVPYIRCHRKLKRIKAERGWNMAAKPGGVVMVDTRAIPPERRLSPWLFLPALAICLLPLCYERAFWPVYALLAAMQPLMYLGSRVLFRNKSEAVDGNLELTQALTRVRRQGWERMWLAMAYSLALMCPAASVAAANPLLSIILMMLVVLAIVAATLHIEFRTRRVQEKLTQQSGMNQEYVDDDSKWLWGLVYYNPQDSRQVVNARVGTNSTVNLARPLGKIMMGFVLVVMLGLPLMGPIIGAVGSTPIELQVQAGRVLLKNGAVGHELEVGAIADIALLEELPSGLMRIVGTSTGTLLRGRFGAPGTGSMQLCLDPGCPPYLLIEMQDGAKYLFGTRDAAQTRAVHAELLTETQKIG